MNTADLRNTLAAAGSSAQYDTDVKKILARKSILSRILAAAVDEFRGMNPEEIEGLIDDSIIIGRVPADPGLTNKKKNTKTGDRITGINTESSELAEGTAVFDIIFYVRSKNGASQIIINLEAQKKEPSEYALLNRALFYACRMISSQKERDFTGMNYDELKRVFSIWICMNMDECIWNNVHFVNDRILGDHEWEGKRDLVNIILLGMPAEIPEEEKKYALHRMICVLLSSDLSVDERMEILEKEYHIRDDADLRKELNEMCNLSEGIYEKGVREGVRKGIRKGARDAYVKTAEKMLADGLDYKTVAKYSGLTLEEVEELASLQPS